MRFKKLSLDESLFDEDNIDINWVPADEIFGEDTDNMIPGGLPNSSPDYDDDFSFPDYIPSVGDELPPEGPKAGNDTGIASLLIDAINDEWRTIDKYNSIVATMKDIGNNESNIIVFQDIIAEEHKHIGQIQEILKTISPNTEEIAKGEHEAQRQFKFVDGKLPVQVMEQVRIVRDYPSSSTSQTSVSDDSSPNAINEYCSIADVDDEM